MTAPDVPVRGARAFAPFEWMVALRYLRPHRGEGSLSVITLFSFLGIVIGVAVLIAEMAVMGGLSHETIQKILGVNGHAFVQPIETPLTDWEAVCDKLTKIPGVRAAVPMVEGAAGISSQYRQSGVLARGVREADLARLPGLSNGLREGSFADFDKAGGIAIGRRLADTLGVRVGDSVSLLIAKGDQTPFGVAPRIKAYPIVAIFQIGMSELDSLFVYMPLAEAQLFFNHEHDVTVVEAFVDDPEAMDAFRLNVEKTIERPLMVTDWRERNKTFVDWFKVQKAMFSLILSLIVVVADFTIIAGLSMLVKDKTADIAILRTMGASRGAMMRIFLIIGATIGFVGAFAGLLLGLAFARNLETIRHVLNAILGYDVFPVDLYFLSQIPTMIEPRDVALVVAMAFGLAVLAAIYPAWRAASLDPVKALRSE